MTDRHLAAILHARSRRERCAPPSEGQPLSLAEAYAIQDRLRDILVGQGEQANDLGKRSLGLKAGQVVMTGSVSALVRPKAGDSVGATYTRLGSVSARFV